MHIFMHSKIQKYAKNLYCFKKTEFLKIITYKLYYVKKCNLKISIRVLKKCIQTIKPIAKLNKYKINKYKNVILILKRVPTCRYEM